MSLFISAINTQQKKNENNIILFPSNQNQHVKTLLKFGSWCLSGILWIPSKYPQTAHTKTDPRGGLRIGNFTIRWLRSADFCSKIGGSESKKMSDLFLVYRDKSVKNFPTSPFKPWVGFFPDYAIYNVFWSYYPVIVQRTVKMSILVIFLNDNELYFFPRHVFKSSLYTLFQSCPQTHTYTDVYPAHYVLRHTNTHWKK